MRPPIYRPWGNASRVHRGRPARSRSSAASHSAEPIQRTPPQPGELVPFAIDEVGWTDAVLLNKLAYLSRWASATNCNGKQRLDQFDSASARGWRRLSPIHDP